MRSADDRLNANLARDLLFRGDIVLRPSPATAASVTAAWHTFLGGTATVAAVILVRNVARARRLVSTALLSEGATVTLPANATHDLVETLKRAKAHLTFANLDAHLNLALTAPAAVAWVEPMAGLPTSCTGHAGWLVIDHADSLPVGRLTPSTGDLLLFGLQLSANGAEAGALLVFRDGELAQRVRALVQAADEPDWAQAAWQLQRLAYHAPRQKHALAELQQALAAAAGLPLLPVDDAPALAHGIAVQIPPECIASTFYHYAQGENTPVAWLPAWRPLHPAATGAAFRLSAFHVERWLLAPLGLTTPAENLAQTVLGIVKAAEYLGVRWRTNPARAAAYAALLNARYGPNHDAYRPAFAIAPIAPSQPAEQFADFAEQACRIG